MATALGEVPVVPAWLGSDPVIDNREAGVIEHRIAVTPQWWARHLEPDFEGEMFDAPGDVLARGDLFELGARAGDGPVQARRLLWATLAWGTGRRHRNNARRIASVRRDPERLGDRLAEAARIGRSDPSAAYRLLRPRSNEVPYLGPPFFTKFLYFSGAGAPSHPSLILDSVLAGALRAEGVVALQGRYLWPPDHYEAYCQVLSNWAAELSSPRRAVAADQVETALFQAYARGAAPSMGNLAG